MSPEKARELFLEQCGPGDRGTLERHGEKAAVAAIMALAEHYEAASCALIELVECARLRGDNELPHPCDDPKLWTARMTDAWGQAEDAADNMSVLG